MVVCLFLLLGLSEFICRLIFVFRCCTVVCTSMVCLKVRRLDRKTRLYRNPQRSSFKPPSWDRSSLQRIYNVSADAHYYNPGDVSDCNVVTRWWKRRQVFARDNPRTVEVQQQAAMYLMAFVVTHIWSTINRILQQMCTSGQRTVFGLVVMHAFFDPLQGFLNFLVYQRARYLQIRRLEPASSRWSAAKKALTLSCAQKKSASDTGPSGRCRQSGVSSVSPNNMCWKPATSGRAVRASDSSSAQAPIAGPEEDSQSTQQQQNGAEEADTVQPAESNGGLSLDNDVERDDTPRDDCSATSMTDHSLEEVNHGESTGA